MPIEHLNAIIDAVKFLFSALISFFVARYTTKQETSRLELSWDREDAVASEEDFKAMAEAVTDYVHDNCGSKQGIALSKVAGIRATETRTFAEKLDDLYSLIRNDSRDQAEMKLSEILKEKREIQRKPDAAFRKKKKK